MMTDFGLGDEYTFSSQIRKLAKVNGITALDALLSYCEENELEHADVRPAIDDQLMEQLMVDANQLRLLKGVNKPVRELW